jgi:hypothetical protein
MAEKFSFGGNTLVGPGILVSSTIAASAVFQLLPLGTIAMFGAADGGSGNGTVYKFQDLSVAARLLRNGPLLTALQRAGAIGGATGFVAVVLGAKTSASAALTSGAEVVAGDQGSWTNGITFEVIAGTQTNTFAVLFSYPDPTSGNTVYVGGLGTKYDNLTTLSQLQAVVAADTLLTPPASTGLPPIVTIKVTTPGPLAITATTNLAGGTGGASQTIAFSDVKAGVDAALTTAFDIGHLVGVYDVPSQAYADAQAVQVSGFGKLRRFIHQVQVTSATSAQTKVQNSEAVANAGIAQANSIDSIRSSVCPQKIAYEDPTSGVTAYVDVAPFICGLAALDGATGDQGPATPLTFDIIPGALGLDYEVLDTTGDRDLAISQGVLVLDQIGSGGTTQVRIAQSVTTAPFDSNGNPWIFGEFSVVRVSDALLANIIAEVESNRPKIIGGGNTTAIMNAVLADVRDVLEDALTDQWITQFDPASITIYSTGQTGTSDIVKYDCAPTLPLNHLGIGQNLLPFSASVSLGGNVTG